MGSGMERYRATMAASRALTEAEVGFLLQGARREMSRHADDHGDIIKSTFEELEAEGVTYIAILGDQGEEMVSFGKAGEPIVVPGDTPRNAGRPLVIERVGSEGLVHAFAGVGRKWRGPGRQGRADRKILAVEMKPRAGTRLISSARRALMMETVAAIVLIMAAIVFWRMSRKAEVLAEQMEESRLRSQRELERDRQLKMLGQMSAVLGHELKNPLAALKGHAQLLQERLADHESEPRVDRIVKETIHLENLVQQVLDFARSGELDLQKVYVDDLVNSVVTFAEADPVEVSVPQDAPSWNLDRRWMERVLINLVQNARQAGSPTDPVELHATIGDELRIVVRDHGGGIEAGMEERIFEPFYTSKATGTGLGLALARQIVSSHGGTIEAVNHEDGGAVFTVRIPDVARKEG